MERRSSTRSATHDLYTRSNPQPIFDPQPNLLEWLVVQPELLNPNWPRARSSDPRVWLSSARGTRAWQPWVGLLKARVSFIFTRLTSVWLIFILIPILTIFFMWIRTYFSQLRHCVGTLNERARVNHVGRHMKFRKKYLYDLLGMHACYCIYLRGSFPWMNLGNLIIMSMDVLYEVLWELSDCCNYVLSFRYTCLCWIHADRRMEICELCTPGAWWILLSRWACIFIFHELCMMMLDNGCLHTQSISMI